MGSTLSKTAFEQYVKDNSGALKKIDVEADERDVGDNVVDAPIKETDKDEGQQQQSNLVQGMIISHQHLSTSLNISHQQWALMLL